MGMAYPLIALGLLGLFVLWLLGWVLVIVGGTISGLTTRLGERWRSRRPWRRTDTRSPRSARRTCDRGIPPSCAGRARPADHGTREPCRAAGAADCQRRDQWIARVGFELSGLTEEDLEALAGGLDPRFACEGDRGRLILRFDVRADYLAEAVRRAEDVAARQLGEAGRDARQVFAEVEPLGDWTIPVWAGNLVGVAEIARMRGFSRQHISKLTELPDFPAHVDEVRGKKLYDGWQVNDFLDDLESEHDGLGDRSP